MKTKSIAYSMIALGTVAFFAAPAQAGSQGPSPSNTVPLAPPTGPVKAGPQRATLNQITGIQVAPNSVYRGSMVTVTVTGIGRCKVLLGTSGAMAHPNEPSSFGDYLWPYGPFPKTMSFRAGKAGTFNIGVFGDDQAGGDCLPKGKTVVETTLKVKESKQPLGKVKPK